MQPNAAEIARTLKILRDTMGIRVQYQGGQWFTSDVQGNRVPVNPANAAAFDDVLQETILNMRAARKPAPAPAPSSTPASRTPASFWQRAVGGIGAARIGGSVLSIGARVGGAIGAGGPVGAALGIGGMALSAVTGIVGGVIRTIVGVVTTGFQLAMRLISGIIQTGLGLIRTVVTTAVAGLVAVFGVLTAAVIKSRDTLTTYARSINSLNAATGMGTGRAGRLINRFNAFGINPEATAGLFENSNPLMLAMRARMMGASSFDAPGAIPQMAQRFQSMSASGPFGNRMARNFLGDMDTPEMRRVLSTPLPILREQERFQSRVQGSLGVEPAMIARVGQQTDMLTNKFRLLGDTALIFLADKVLPYLNQKLDEAANFIAANGDKIAGFITGAVDFFIGGAEKVFNFFSQHGPAIAAAAKSAFSWVVNDLPPMLMRGGAVMLDVFGSMLDGIGNFATGLIQHLPIILSTLDIVLNGLRLFTANAIGIVAGLLSRAGINVGGTTGTPAPTAPINADAIAGNRDRGFDWSTLTSPYERQPGVITNNFLPFGRAIAAAPKVLRAVQATGKALPAITRIGAAVTVGYGAYRGYGAYQDFQANGGVGGFVNGVMGEGGRAARDNFLGMVPVSNLASKQSEVESMLRNIGNITQSGADKLRGMAGGLDKQAAGWQATLAGLTQPSKERQGLEQDLLKQIADNTKQAAANTDPKHLQDYHKQAAELIKYVVGQDVADRYMLLSRT